MNLTRARALSGLIIASALLAPTSSVAQNVDWPLHNLDLAGSRFAQTDQITPENVADLEVAWVHRSGDRYDGSGQTAGTEYQVTPLVVDGLLYLTPDIQECVGQLR